MPQEIRGSQEFDPSRPSNPFHPSSFDIDAATHPIRPLQGVSRVPVLGAILE
jgi:hypothetical protein